MMRGFASLECAPNIDHKEYYKNDPKHKLGEMEGKKNMYSTMFLVYGKRLLCDI